MITRHHPNAYAAAARHAKAIALADALRQAYATPGLRLQFACREATDAIKRYVALAIPEEHR